MAKKVKEGTLNHSRKGVGGRPTVIGHVSKSTMKKLETAAKAKRGKAEIKIVCQPARSPDTNANDLAFYPSLNSKMKGKRPFDLTKLYKLVQKHFWEYPEEKLDSIFNYKRIVMQQIVIAKGTNNYALPRSRDAWEAQ